MIIFRRHHSGDRPLLARLWDTITRKFQADSTWPLRSSIATPVQRLEELSRESGISSAGGTARHWYPALGVSTLVHLGAIVLLAGASIQLAADKSGTAVDTRWTSEMIPLEREPLEQFQALSTPISPADAGQRSSAATACGPKTSPN